MIRVPLDQLSMYQYNEIVKWLLEQDIDFKIVRSTILIVAEIEISEADAIAMRLKFDV